MIISVNSNCFAQTTKQCLKDLFDSIIDKYETLHSVQILIKSKEEHEIERAEYANQPLDESDSKTKKLLEKIRNNKE